MSRYRVTSRLRLTHHVALALVVILAIPAPAWARPTHGPIEPIAAGVDRDASIYFPLDVGRTWTFHDSLGIRRRHVIAGAATVVAKNGTVLDQLRRREIYEVPALGEPKLTERWLFQLDPERGIVSLGGVDPEDLRGAIVLPGGEIEMPKKLTPGTWWIAYGIEYRVQGIADVELEAGSFSGCVVVDAKGAHKLPSGERADTRTFFCPGVGEVAALVMVQGAWRPGLELEKWDVMKPTNTTKPVSEKPRRGDGTARGRGGGRPCERRLRAWIARRPSDRGASHRRCSPGDSVRVRVTTATTLSACIAPRTGPRSVWL